MVWGSAECLLATDKMSDEAHQTETKSRQGRVAIISRKIYISPGSGMNLIHPESANVKKEKKNESTISLVF